MASAPITITADTAHSAAALCEMADALPLGVLIRYRADFWGWRNEECPYCCSDAVRWVRNDVPEAWDRVACNECDRQWQVEAHAVEEIAREIGDPCQCFGKAIRRVTLHGVEVATCGRDRCTELQVSEWISEERHQNELRMAGRLR